MTRINRTAALPLAAAALLAACSGANTQPVGEARAEPQGEAVASGTGGTADPATPPRHSSIDDPGQPDGGPVETTLSQIPARFVGTWAPDKRACAGNYDYQPTFQRVFIERERIGFFETSGDVQAVAEAGGSTRVTVRERIGDSYPVYPIMISLADGGQALNYIRDGERQRLVKCSSSTQR